MNDNPMLQTLEQHRDLILLAEIGALIHDLGKLSAEFVRAYASDCPTDPATGETFKFDHSCIVPRASITVAENTEYDRALEALQGYRAIFTTNPSLAAALTKLEGLLTARRPGQALTYLAQPIAGLDAPEEVFVQNLVRTAAIQPLALGLSLPLPDRFEVTALPLLPFYKLFRFGDDPWVAIRQTATSVFDALLYHHDKPKEMPLHVRLLSAPHGADGLDSGMDKGAVSNAAQQPMAHTYIATAFGYETAPIPVDAITNGLSPVRHRVATVLTDELGNVIAGTARPGDVRGPVLLAAKEAFLQALGETRRAANDVTLWDHSFSVASLYKAALAKVFLDGHWTDPKKINWRILRISFDGLAFLAQAHHVTDILGRQAALKETLNRVQALLETTYPLGNEVYRDEDGSAFIVPDLEGDNVTGTKLRGLIERLILDTFRAAAPMEGELVPSLEISQASRGATNLGLLLAQALERPTPFLDSVRCWWHGLPEEICTVCGLRPMGWGASSEYYGNKARDRNVCYLCLERRGNRSQDWASSAARQTGRCVWVDEIADLNGRAALVVGTFGLEHWLDGRYLNSLFAQSLDDWRKRDKDQEARPPVSEDYIGLVTRLEEELRDNRKNSDIFGNIAREAYREYQNRPAEEFYKAMVEERDAYGLAQGVASTDWSTQARLLVLFLLRKHASFARLRRVWETTRAFWEVVRDQDIPQALGQAGPRLEVAAIFAPDRRSDSLGRYHTYEMALGPANLDVVWDPQRSAFITADNLCYVAKQLGWPVSPKAKQETAKEYERRLAREAACWLVDKMLNVWEREHDGQGIPIEEPRGYGAQNRKLGKLVQVQAEVVKDEQGNLALYTPVIPILAEPRTFMALVPADKALEVAQAVKARYEREMSKVRNRLPLTLGLVFFPRRTPLYAVLDAGRRMLELKSGEEEWSVIQQPGAAGVYGSHIELMLGRDGQRPVKWKVDRSLGGDCYDTYYPYFFVSQASTLTVATALEKRPSYFESRDVEGNPAHLVHVAKLEAGDVVRITPSHFDFQWLDTTGRRFEVSYDDGLRRGQATRPYLLEELDTLATIWKLLADADKGLTDTRISNLKSLLMTRVERWAGGDIAHLKDDDEFKEYVQDTFINVRDLKWWQKELEAEEQSLLWQAGCDGTLFDVLELYQQILKRKSERQEQPTRGG